MRLIHNQFNLVIKLVKPISDPQAYVDFTLRTARRKSNLLRPRNQPEDVEYSRDVGSRVLEQSPIVFAAATLLLQVIVASGDKLPQVLQG